MKKVVCSVPHSGTRSLMEHLGVDHYEHFGSSPSFFVREDFEAHIPVRDPLDLARSWAKRGKPLDELLKRYQAMIEFIDHRENVVIWLTESLTEVIGAGEHIEGDENVARYQDALMGMVKESISGTMVGHG